MKRFFSLIMINSHKVTHKIWVYSKHSSRFNISFFWCGMCGMSFLSEKFCTSQENSRSHLPSHNICPLIDHKWQITIWVNPISIRIPDNSLWSRTNNKFFLEFSFWINDNFSVFRIFESIMGNYRTLLCKSSNMRCFLGKIRFWDKEGEISILMSGFFDHLIKNVSHIFPNCISIRLDNHTSSHGWIFS